MDFRRVSSSGEVLEKVPLLLPTRSLLVMSGPARYLWSHGIATRLHDQVPTQQNGDKTAVAIVPRGTRTSVTFRAVRKPPCICKCGQWVPSLSVVVSMFAFCSQNILFIVTPSNPQLQSSYI